jgi:hypothetical protein
MTHQEFTSYISAVGGLIVSWPVVVLVLLVIFRKPILGLSNSIQKGKVGPVEFERFEKLVERSEQSLSTIEKIHLEIAKSRVVELEVTMRVGIVPFTSTEKTEIVNQIRQLRTYISELESSPRKY